MEAALFIWLAGVIGSVGHLLGWVAFFTVVGAIGTFAIRLGTWSDDRESTRGPRPSFKTHAIVLILGVFIAISSAMMPDQRTMYLAGGAYLGQKAVQSETANKVMLLVNTKLDEYIAEMEAEVKSKIEKTVPSKKSGE